MKITRTPGGILSLSNSKTLVANNTTVDVNVFGFTGTIHVVKLYGIVTTVLGANHTAAGFNVNDGTNTVQLTLAAGTVLSAAQVGSQIDKDALAAVAVSYIRADQVRLDEPATSGLAEMSDFTLNAKSVTTCNIRYHYATTDAPTSGAIKFYLYYEPLSDNALVTAV